MGQALVPQMPPMAAENHRDHLIPHWCLPVTECAGIRSCRVTFNPGIHSVIRHWNWHEIISLQQELLGGKQKKLCSCVTGKADRCHALKNPPAWEAVFHSMKGVQKGRLPTCSHIVCFLGFTWWLSAVLWLFLAQCLEDLLKNRLWGWSCSASQGPVPMNPLDDRSSLILTRTTHLPREQLFTLKLLEILP